MSTVETLVAARADLKTARETVKIAQGRVAFQRKTVADLTLIVKQEREEGKAARVAKVAAAKQATLDRATARAAKAQAALEALRLKQNSPKAIRARNRKASPVTLISKDQAA